MRHVYGAVVLQHTMIGLHTPMHCTVQCCGNTVLHTCNYIWQVCSRKRSTCQRTSSRHDVNHARIAPVHFRYNH